MKVVLSRFLLLVFTFLVSFNIALGFDDAEEEFGSSSAKPAPAGKVVYTRMNIWFEKPMKILPSYHRGGMLPVGTKVTLGDMNKKAIKFTREDGMQFRLYSWKHHHMSGPDMAKLLFSEKNPMAKGGEFHKFSKMERQQIKQGELKKGMSKEAAIMAYGIPPKTYTHSLDQNTWTYFKHRYDKVLVNFQNNRIASIQD